MLHYIIDAILSAPPTTIANRDLERAQWLRPRYGILAALTSAGCVISAIINTEFDVRIIMSITALLMAMWAWSSFRYQRRH